MSAELTARQQRFADLALGGMPASRAYRDAGYSATTDRVAEAAGSRMLRNVRVAAYLAERRAAAADRAELTYAGFLREFADFARDKDVDQAHRLAAYKFVTEHLARAAPLASAVAEATGEGTIERAARISVGFLEAVMAGRMPIEQGLQCVDLCRKATEGILSAQVSKMAAGLGQDPQEPAPSPAPDSEDPLIPPRSRPKWLKTAPGTRDTAARASPHERRGSGVTSSPSSGYPWRA